MPQKVTIQDIADALGISRNTVSKAMNNTGVLKDTTRDKILETAALMGYKQFVYAPAVKDKKTGENREIALFTCSMPNASHFASHLLDTFQERISRDGYRFSIYMIREYELENRVLPVNFNEDAADGIICIEMFDPGYSEFLCSIALPVLLVDTVANPSGMRMHADLLYMENHDSVYQMVKQLLDSGITEISFVGDYHNCQSFYERWLGYRDALTDSGIECKLENSILETDKSPYEDPKWLGAKIKELPVLPRAMICTNDFMAIQVMQALKLLNDSVPEDILLCGFDNAPESVIVEPQLTTVCIPSQAMGTIAADLLLSRIENPIIPYRTMHVRTEIVCRESTGAAIQTDREQEEKRL